MVHAKNKRLVKFAITKTPEAKSTIASISDKLLNQQKKPESVVARPSINWQNFAKN